MPDDERIDISKWQRVHALSLTDIHGVDQRELLLELHIAPVVTTEKLPNPQVHALPERFVLGLDAASILLRLLLAAGVEPKDDKTVEHHSH